MENRFSLNKCCVVHCIMLLLYAVTFTMIYGKLIHIIPFTIHPCCLHQLLKCLLIVCTHIQQLFLNGEDDGKCCEINRHIKPLMMWRGGRREILTSFYSSESMHSCKRKTTTDLILIDDK